MPTLVIFGASGDLTSRKLIPALYELFRKNRLPKETQIVGFSRFEVGEGIEKAPTKNFADEVAEMTGQRA